MAQFADKFLAQQREKEKKKNRFNVTVNLGGKTVSVAPASQAIKKETQKVSQQAAASQTAKRQQAAQKTVQAYKNQAKKSSSKSSKSSSSSKASQPAAPEPTLLPLPSFGDPMSIPRLSAARSTMFASNIPALRTMAQNSTEWAGLNNMQNVLAQNPQQNQNVLNQIQQRKTELENQNKALGEQNGLTLDERGFWRVPGVQQEQASAGERLIQSMLNPATAAYNRRSNAKGETGATAYTPSSLPVQGTADMIEEAKLTRQNLLDTIQENAPKTEVNAEYRINNTLDSIVGRLASAPRVLYETARQQAENVQADENNIELQRMQQEADNLRAYLTTATLESGGEEYQKRYKEYQQLLKDIENAKTNTAVDPNSPGMLRMRQANRSAQNATRGLTGAAKAVGDFAVNAANQAALWSTALINPSIPAALTGIEATAGKAAELNERGISPGEALGRGLVSGGIEYVTEKVPVDKFMDLVRTGGNGVIRNLVRQAGVEATEEGISYLANGLADIAARDPEAEISVNDLLGSMASGAAGGLLFGAGGTVIGRLVGNTSQAADTQTTSTPANAAQASASPRLPNDVVREILDPESSVVDVRIQEPEAPSAAQAATQAAAMQPEIRTMTGTTNYDVTGYTLSEDAVTLGNALRESGDPVGGLQELKAAYQPAYERAVQAASDYVRSYNPQGTVIQGADEYGRGGYRASQNESWYRDFYAQNGRAPQNSDVPAIAQQLVRADRAGTQFGFPEQSQRILDAINELESRVFTREGFTGFTQNAAGDVQALYDMTPDQVGTVDAYSSVGAATGGFDPYSRMANEYGTIEPGWNPARTVDVPRSTNGTDRVRRFIRTTMEAEATPETMLADFEQMVVNGEASYNPRSNKKDLESAIYNIEHNGVQRALETWESKMQSGGNVGTDDLIAAQILYRQAAKAGDTQTAMRLAGQLAAEYTKAGQAVQSAILLKKTTPEGRFAYIDRSVKNLEKDLQETRGKKAPKIEMDETLVQNVLNATDEAGLDLASEELYKSIARQIPGTWADKANAFRYLAMLGNPRTHIRNLTGNVMFSVPVAVKNKIGAVMEKALIRDGERTKSLTPANAATRAFAAEDAQEMMDVLKGGGKYNPSDIIREYQDPFSPKWLLGRTLNKVSKANSNALDAEDSIFLGYHYRNALAGYMAANGLNPDAMKNNLGEATDELMRARKYAINEAQKATFRDASAVATALFKFEQTNAATKIIVGGFVPFKKTPVNILKRGVEYSPAGIIKGIKEAAVDLRNGTKTANEVIDSFASGITGTGLMALGMMLAKNGWLTGADAEEKKQQYLNDAEGVQSYALNLGGFTYTVDWSAPASLPLFMGVELWNSMQELGQTDDQAEGLANAFTNALQNITEPVFNLTMMDGVQGAIQGAAYSQGNAVTSAIGSMISDYLGQFNPTILGQIARTVDDTRRTTYKGKSITGISSIDSWLQRQANKIPGLSQQNVPYMDVFGNTDTEPNAALRAFENFLSPGYISRRRDDNAMGGLQDLYRATGDASALPNKANASFSVNGEKVELTQDQYVKFVQTRGQAIQDGLGDMFQSAAYASMTDAEKLAAVQKLYEYANAVAKTGVSAYEMDNTQKLAQASGVSPGVYYAYKEKMDALEAANDPDYRWKTTEQIVGDQTLDEQTKNALLTNLIIPQFGQTKDGVNSAVEEYNTEYANVMAPETYIRIRNQYSNISGQFDDQENAAGKRQAAWIQYLDQTGLPSDVRAQVEDDKKFYTMIPAKPESTSFDMLARYGGKNEQTYASAVQQSGLSLDQYYAVKDYKSSLSGSGQKERVIQWMRNQGWSSAQISAAGRALGYKM